MAISLRLVPPGAARESIYEQRYAVYVEELKYRQPHANPTARAVVEPLDDTGSVFGLYDGDRLAGSVRVNYGDDHPDPAVALGDYVTMYHLQDLPLEILRRTCIVTKMALNKAYRSAQLMQTVSTGLYTHTRDHRPMARWCLIDCVPPLEAYFEALGYRRIGQPIRHPAVDHVVPMGFAIYDQAHFRLVGSPLGDHCPRQDDESVRWFEQTFGAAWAERFAE